MVSKSQGMILSVVVTTLSFGNTERFLCRKNNVSTFKLKFQMHPGISQKVVPQVRVELATSNFVFSDYNH